MVQQREVSIRENYLKVLDQIEEAAGQVGREPSSIKLIVVTKGHPVETIQEAIEAGARVFGENYAEEGIAKMRSLNRRSGIEWHMIGHVQSRKSRLVCEYYNFLHSLDSMRVAQRLDRFAGELGMKLPVLLECNVSGEENKFGWSAWQEDGWSDLKNELTAILALSNLDVRGLMTMAPFFDEPEMARPYFRKLHRFKDYLEVHLPKGNWQELSMGMSGDFKVAIHEGATMVRIGTAILGERLKPMMKKEMEGH